MPAPIIKPRLVLGSHMDDLGWYIMYNQQLKMVVSNLNNIVIKPNVTQIQFPNCKFPYNAKAVHHDILSTTKCGIPVPPSSSIIHFIIHFIILSEAFALDVMPFLRRV